MSWLKVAATFPRLDSNDLIRFSLSFEEEKVMLDHFNRSIMQAAENSADMAIITLRKILVKYPEWAEAVLLYGICLAIEGQYKRAHAAIEHALSLGLRKEDFVVVAQESLDLVKGDLNKKSHSVSSTNKSKIPFSIPKSNPLIQEENEIRPRKHMQAPILMKAPRRPDRARLASDKERRELLMKATSSNGEIPDDEIDVSIPKTPAEKLRIAISVVLVTLAAVIITLLIVFVMIPFITNLNTSNDDRSRLEYLHQALEDNVVVPEISSILKNYNEQFPMEDNQYTETDTSDDNQDTALNNSVMITDADTQTQ